MSPDVSARLEIGGQEVICNLASSWQELCDEVQGGPFLRPEWISAYIRAFEPRSEVVIVTAREGHRLIAVLPLIRKWSFYAGIPLVKLAGPANSHSVRFDILRAKGGIGDAAVAAMWKALSRTPGWQVLELPLFPQDGACADLMASATKDGFPTLMLLVQNSPVLRFRVSGNGTPAQVIGGPNRHFRHELRRYARILATELGSEPQVSCKAAAPPELLEEFFRLEESGWKGRKGSAINCRADTRQFYQQIAEIGAEGGYFRMHSLEANGVMAAGAFSVATDNGFFPMKIAHDEKLRRGGPGHVLFSSIVNECSEQQIPELFFGGTDEYYKSLWTQDSVPHVSAFVFSSDIRSRLAYEIRKRLLTPLGKLRRQFRGRMGRDRKAPKQRVQSKGPEKKQGGLVTVKGLPQKESANQEATHQ